MLAIGVRNSCAAVERNSDLRRATSVSCVMSRKYKMRLTEGTSTVREDTSSTRLAGLASDNTCRVPGGPLTSPANTSGRGAPGSQRPDNQARNSRSSRPVKFSPRVPSSSCTAGLTYFTRWFSSKVSKPSGLRENTALSCAVRSATCAWVTSCCSRALRMCRKCLVKARANSSSKADTTPACSTKPSLSRLCARNTSDTSRPTTTTRGKSASFR